jgi:hypothetical protein
MVKATFRSAGLAALALGLAAGPALADEDAAPPKRRHAGVAVQRTAMAPVAVAMPYVVPPCFEAFDALVLRCVPAPQVVSENDPVQGGLLRTIRGDYNGPYPAIVPDP